MLSIGGFHKAKGCLTGFLTLVTCAFLAPAAGTAAAAETQWGLHVTADGTLTLGGEPFHGMGLNFFDGFNRTIGNPMYQCYVPSLKKTADSGIPFIRVPLCGFWANGLKVYLDNPAEYFREMDKFVKACEDNNIGIIATLFWTRFSVSDLVGEKVSNIGNVDSKTMSYARDYAGEVVSRYKNSPALWGWEIGNEWNLGCDLYKVMEAYPPVVPSLGTPDARGPGDEVRSRDVEVFYGEIAGTVRDTDPYRMITNGDADYRAAQYNLRTHGTWAHDTEEELLEIMGIFSPHPIDTISIHIYLDEDEDGLSQKKFGVTVELEEQIDIYMNHARQLNKALFMGEFLAVNDANFVRKMEAFRASGLQLSAVWNFETVGLRHRSFSDDSFMFTRTAEANEYYRNAGLQNVDGYWPKTSASATP